MKKKLFLSLLLVCLITFTQTSCGSSSKEESGDATSSFKSDYIISAEDLKDKLDDENVIFIDARGKDAATKTGFIKNAVIMTWQDIADVEGKNPGDKGWGHILNKDVLAKKLGDLGLDKSKEIILYSTANDGWGEDGRILWELKAAGYDKLKMVDGGIKAIETSGIKLVKEETALPKVEVTIDEINYANTINTDQLTADFDSYKIIDSREKDEYDGAVKYGEAKGGHIKGAVNVPYSSLYTDKGLLKSNDDIAKIFSDLGFQKDDAIVTYCTGGIRSAYMQLILETLGYTNVKNYEGSYYNWSAVNEVE